MIERQDELYESLNTGLDGLIELAKRIARVSLADLQQLSRKMEDSLKPLAELIDTISKFPRHEPSRAETVHSPHESRGRYKELESVNLLPKCTESDSATMDSWIYCELFHHCVDAFMKGPTERCRDSLHCGYFCPDHRLLDFRSRVRFIATCMPDNQNHRNARWEHFEPSDLPSDSMLGLHGSRRQQYIFQMLQSKTYRNRDKAIRKFLVTSMWPDPMRRTKIPSIDMPHIDEEELEIYGDWVPFIAAHLGLESLLWVIPCQSKDKRSTVQTRLKEIRTAVGRIPTELLVNPKPETYGGWNKWIGWPSSLGDIEDGIGTKDQDDVEVTSTLHAIDIATDFHRRLSPALNPPPLA